MESRGCKNTEWHRLRKVKLALLDRLKRREKMQEMKRAFTTRNRWISGTILILKEHLPRDTYTQVLADIRKKMPYLCDEYGYDLEGYEPIDIVGNIVPTSKPPQRMPCKSAVRTESAQEPAVIVIEQISEGPDPEDRGIEVDQQHETHQDDQADHASAELNG